MAIDFKVATVPVPVRLTVCGLERPLSTTVRVALRAPWTLGVNVTEIPQLAPAFKLVGHVFVST